MDEVGAKRFLLVSGLFNCSYNSLTSLEGAPEKVGGSFFCSHNDKLTSLEGSPREVGGKFYCYFNDIDFTKEDVEAVCDVSGRVFV